MISVMLVDDQSMIRMGFRMILEAEPDIQVVAEAGDGVSAISTASALEPDVILMDIRMPGMDGITASSRMVDDGLTSKILILTTFDLDEYVLSGLRAGASGFLLKDASPADLITAIRAVARGDSVIAPSATRRLLDKFLPLLPDPALAVPGRAEGVLHSLTERERTVFDAIASGASNREIAQELYLSEGTVKVHVSRILAKLDVRDRVQAVILAYEAGIVRPGSGPETDHR